MTTQILKGTVERASGGTIRKRPVRRWHVPAFLSDQVLFFTTLIIVSFGLIMIYSTTAVVAEGKFGDPYYYVKRQGVAAVIGLALLILVSHINLTKLKNVSHLFLPISLCLLLLVFIPGLGMRAGGALRWVGVGPLRFQPVELVKILSIFFVAGYISRYELRIKELKYGVVVPFIFISFLAGLLLLQPDFGSAAVIALITISLLFACGGSYKHILSGAGIIATLAGLLILISPYRMKRVLAFLDPFEDHSGQGYQLIQSLIAIGNGGLTGVGIGESQQKLFFLPAAHNDFIFAVVGEELGFIGCVTLLALFLVVLWRGLSLASHFMNSTYHYALAIGLSLLIVMPALLNLGVALGLLPTKGLALPLVSYGGSSIIISLTAIGLLLALARTFLRKANVHE